MSVFVDAGVFYAHHDTDAERHEDAVTAFDELLEGTYGQPYTSDYVLDETITRTRVRTDSFETADVVASRVLGADPFPDVFEVINVAPDDLRATLETVRRFDDHDRSFTDASTVALCESYDIDSVLSFDDDFDGLIDRVDLPRQGTGAKRTLRPSGRRLLDEVDVVAVVVDGR